MDKKTRSKPMTQILDRLRAYGEFLIIVFGESLLLDESIPIEVSQASPRAFLFAQPTRDLALFHARVMLSLVYVLPALSDVTWR